MKKLFQIFVYLLLYQYAVAQPGKEAWHWQFGNKCALDFSSGTPVAGVSAINQPEGSASLSDSVTGQLLFYTDGVTVWNSNNVPMPNGYGLMGHYSSTQSATIVPWPGHAGFYYIITNDQAGYFGNNLGTHYSIVDMSQNNGLGDVVVKNKLLMSPRTSESCTAIKHCNNTDYWILIHVGDSYEFMAFLLTTNGLNTIPVITSTGTYQQDGNTTTTFKVSTDGKKLATGHFGGNGTVEIFDFNRLDGTLSNPIIVNFTAYDNGPYAVSFSPDNSKLYASFPAGDPGHKLYQLDLSVYTQSAISASKVSLSSGEYNYWGMQLAPDGKIYITGDSTGYPFTSLSVINSPNALGVNCNFQQEALPLAIGTSSSYGLSYFIDTGYDFNSTDTLKYSYSTDTSFCKGESVTLNGEPSFSTWAWSTGVNAPSITINDTGNYTAIHNATSTCIGIDNFHASFKPQPKVNLGNDTMFYCTGSTFLRAFNPNSTYLWNTGETAGGITVSLPGAYWVQVNEDGCKTSDTIRILADTSKHTVSFPNIVTPNGDGINDYINFSTKYVAVLHIEVFNRWGKKIFECDNSNPIWYPDQTNSDDGTYYYIGEYEVDCTESVTNRAIKGFITVIR